MKKKILIPTVACVGLLAVFILTFSAERYKGRIEAAATEAMGEKVVIGGSVSLGFAAFKPALAAHDVVIGEAGKDLVIEIGTLNISLSSLFSTGDTPVFVQAENLRVGGRVIGDYESPVILNGDGFDATDIKGTYGSGDVTGKASYKNDRLHVEAKATGLEYKDLAEGFSGDDVSIDFTGDAHGKTGAQLTGTLRGRLLFSGGEGKMSGRAVNFWGGELLFAFLKARAQETKINCLIGEFGITDGVMTARHAILDTDAVAIFGTGNINLVRESMSMRFTPRPKERAILNIATPMLAQGKFGNVRVAPDPQGMATTVGKFLLGAVNPVMAVVPYVFQDTADKNACVSHLKGGK